MHYFVLVRTNQVQTGLLLKKQKHVMLLVERVVYGKSILQSVVYSGVSSALWPSYDVDHNDTGAMGRSEQVSQTCLCTRTYWGSNTALR